MSTSEIFISDNATFESIWTKLGQIFLEKSRLPQNVYYMPFDYYLFAEFDWAMSAEFWLELKILASYSADKRIIVVVLDPHPIDYFFKNFGYYNVFYLSTNASANDYWNAIISGPPDSPADAMLYNSNVVTWFADSATWAIWGQREFGICVAGFKESKINLYREESLRSNWFTTESALRDLIPMFFRDKRVPESFSLSILLNYRRVISKGK
jgi:hypothetical protein